MSTFSTAQRHAIRFFGGWSEGFTNLYQRIEGAMARIESLYPDGFARITNAINGTPPGLLAQLEQVKADLFASRGRFKANTVGSISLNRAEVQQLRDLGRELVGDLCQVLGIARGRDVFAPGGADDYAHEGYPGVGSKTRNYRGK